MALNHRTKEARILIHSTAVVVHTQMEKLVHIPREAVDNHRGVVVA